MECGDQHGCSLQSDELLERIAKWRAVSSRAVSRRIEADRITSVYPSDPEVLAHLKDLIAAEATCCSFLQFTVEEEAHHTTVELTFPEDARPVVESLLALPRPTAT